VRDEQRGHSWLVHANADPGAGDARLRHLENSAPDTVNDRRCTLVIGQTSDSEILPEFSKSEVASAKVVLPIAIGINLIDEDGPMLAAVSGQIPLTIAVDIEPPHHPPALNRCLPNGSVNSLPLPRDVTQKTDVY
jgi:hypothetical protein